MIKYFIAILISAALLSSCAAPKNISLDESFWQEKNHQVAVTAVKSAKPGLTLTGQQGLLALAINHAVANNLENHISKTDLSWYYALPDDFSKNLNARKISAVATGTHSDNDDDQYLTNLAAQHHASELLVMHLNAIGIIRNYYSVIPTGAPKAYVILNGELIDQKTKQVKWRHLAEIRVPIRGEWDQPSNYPNVTAAIKEAIVLSKQEILDSFFSGH